MAAPRFIGWKVELDDTEADGMGPLADKLGIEPLNSTAALVLAKGGQAGFGEADLLRPPNDILRLAADGGHWQSLACAMEAQQAYAAAQPGCPFVELAITIEDGAWLCLRADSHVVPPFWAETRIPLAWLESHLPWMEGERPPWDGMDDSEKETTVMHGTLMPGPVDREGDQPAKLFDAFFARTDASDRNVPLPLAHTINGSDGLMWTLQITKDNRLAVTLTSALKAPNLLRLSAVWGTDQRTAE